MNDNNGGTNRTDGNLINTTDNNEDEPLLSHHNEATTLDNEGNVKIITKI